ncbi:MAG: proton-conducting transporter membrane subunit, partial [Planctomycetota bacterium]|nr:proton-conducting transporter membrane subunit [Planctomycetota bacterium]
MEDSRLLLLLLAVFAPVATGAFTLLLPKASIRFRTLAAFAGMLASVAALAAYVDQHGIAAPAVAEVAHADTDADHAHESASNTHADETRESEAASPVVGVPFVPSINLLITFNPDALGLFFAFLIAGIGVLIVIYARAYFGPAEGDLFRFYPMLGLFATAMIGLVLSDNMLSMLLFWEMTSIGSFLLIGWDRNNPKAVRLALQALVVTGTGGLVLMAGLILLAQSVGTWSLREAIQIIASGGVPDSAQSLFNWALVCCFIGAATKSAQWPFHFWLPGAMAAPTPVSAYLHSATMVKAGVYLFARFAPALMTHETWSLTLVGFGAVTMLLGGFLALRSQELKKIFAYTTVSQLGLLTAAYGLGRLSDGHGGNLIWPVMQILNHALYKAPLFMIAGAIMRLAGRKELHQLKGLFRSHTHIALICLVAAYAMGGGPFTLGFVAKEAFFYQIVHAAETRPIIWAVAVMGVLTAAFNVAIFIRILTTFLARPTSHEARIEHDPHAAIDSADHHNAGHADHHDLESPRSFWGVCLWAPAALLAALQILGGVAPGLFQRLLLAVETNREY